MQTEITVIPAGARPDGGSAGLGVVFYDAECGVCRALAERHAARLARHGYRAEPLQGADVAARCGVSPVALRTEMHALTPDGRCVAGLDAFVAMAQGRTWSRPLAALAVCPGVNGVLRRLYRWVAAHRNCGAGACRLPDATRVGRAKELELREATFRGGPSLPWGRVGTVGLVGLVGLLALWVATIGWAASGEAPAWVRMWGLAVATYLAAKAAMVMAAQRAGAVWNRRALVAFGLGWVGMNPWEFLKAANGSRGPLAGPGGRAAARENGPRWLAPLARIGLGAVLVWGVAAASMEHSPLAAGWAGMVGLILMLHFGLFDLAAVAWGRAGVRVTPLMRAPTRARSVGEFWGERWNRAFHVLAHELVYRPVRRRAGRVAGVWAVFLASGLVHDLVIAVPAGAGWGGPTAYFLVQAAALTVERSALGRRLRLGQGWRGRVFAWLALVGPVGWLFPPVFVERVIVPMLRALGVG